MKLSDILFEGMWVIKSKDGVEKRFKDDKSEAAQAWANSIQKKQRAAPVDKAGQRKAAENLCWQAISTASEWTEMDEADVIRTQIIPKLKKMGYAAGGEAKYGEAFIAALDEASHPHGTYDKLLKFLDAAVKAGQGKGMGWKKYVKEMSSSLE